MSLNDMHDPADKIAAAEAELKAAQEKLAAVKAKLAENASSTEELEAPEIVEAAEVFEAAGTVDNATVADASVTEPSAAPEPPNPAQPGYVPPSYDYANNTQQAPGAVPPQQPYYAYQQQTYQQPGQQPYQQPQQPYYQQPYGQPVVSSKDHVAAGLLAIFLGTLGVHKFYLGYNTSGFIMLAVTILGSLLTFGLAGAVIAVISIIEGILYLTKSQSEFEQAYVFNKREWF